MPPGSARQSVFCLPRLQTTAVYPALEQRGDAPSQHLKVGCVSCTNPHLRMMRARTEQCSGDVTRHCVDNERATQLFAART